MVIKHFRINKGASASNKMVKSTADSSKLLTKEITNSKDLKV